MKPFLDENIEGLQHWCFLSNLLFFQNWSFTEGILTVVSGYFFKETATSPVSSSFMEIYWRTHYSHPYVYMINNIRMENIFEITDEIISKCPYNCIWSSVLRPKYSVATPAVIAVMTSGTPEENKNKNK